MGNQCSALRGGKIKQKESYKADQKTDEVFTTVESGEKSPLLQRKLPPLEEGGAVKEEPVEETLGRQEEEKSSEELSCSEKSSAVSEVYTPSSCLSEPHESVCSASTAKKEADWVENNMAKLIQSTKEVMPVADEMVEQKIIHNEMYANIRAAKTSQEQMRVLYWALTSTKAKSAFYRILQRIQPEICETEEVIKEVRQKHKAYLRKRFRFEFEGTDKDHKDAKSLDKIYTELHIIQGESERVNKEHEIWEIEDKARRQTAEGTKINCNNIFKSSVSSGQEARAIRTVMTKGDRKSVV